MLSARAAIFTIGLALLACYPVRAEDAAAPKIVQVAQARITGAQQLPSLPPELLNQLERQVERQSTLAASPSSLSPPGAPNTTPRAVDRGARPLEPSALELDYSHRADRRLTMFGRDILQVPIAAAPISGAIADGYLLGIGDDVILNFRGSISRGVQARINREGTLVIADLAPIPAAGRRFGDFRADVEATVKRTMPNTEVYVSLTEVHQINVIMTGQVQNPGPRQFSAFASVFQALSGNLLPNSSLRRISVTHAGKVRSVDLYEYLVHGTPTEQLDLFDGDEIFVPVLESTVAIAGPVGRPGIYELLSNSINAGDLIALGGGLVRPSGNRYLRLSLDPTGRDQTSEFARPASSRLNATDILIVQRSEDLQVGQVVLDGHVRVPGQRSLAEVPTVRALLGGPEQVMTDPYLSFGAILSVDPRTFSQRFQAVNLVDVINGKADVPLSPGSTLIVLSKDDLRFLGSADVQAVLSGRAPPRLRSGQQAGVIRRSTTSVLSEADQSASTAVARATQAGGTPASSSLDNGQQILSDPGNGAPGNSPYTNSVNANSPYATTPNGNALIGTAANASQVQPEAACRSLQRLASLVGSDGGGRFASALNPAISSDTVAIENILPCPPIFDKYLELMPFLLEHALTLQGEVREPGIYPITGSTSLAAITESAGGISRTADLRNIELTRLIIDQQTGSSELSRQELNLRPADFGTVLLNPGDSVNFKRIFKDREDGPVLLSGEFQRPGLYDLKRGERLSSVIQRAGGYTAQAFPYGAVLSRESARAQEVQGRERTIRDLEAELGGAVRSASELSSGGDSTASATAQVQIAITALRDTPAVGRIPFEADPDALVGRPDLDLILEPGDKIYLPKRPTYVSIQGDVLNPGAQEFVEGLSVNDYILRAGGTTDSADLSRIFVILPNGQAEPLHSHFWDFHTVNVPPGSSIIVPRDLSLDPLLVVRDITQVLSQVALSAASLVVISR